MKLGKLQTLWVGELAAHPERQVSDVLGSGTPRKYRACCLGELLICSFRIKRKKLPFFGKKVEDISVNDSRNASSLQYTYEDYGLRSETGELDQTVTGPLLAMWGIVSKERGEQLEAKAEDFDDLAEMNDEGMTWTEIAKFIEAKPDIVFTKSV